MRERNGPALDRFFEVARAALPRSPAASRYLSDLAGRFAALAQVAAGRHLPARRLARGLRNARAVLARFEGDWSDGDENLVRDELDDWRAREGEPRAAAAAAVLRTAERLSRIHSRRETVRCFLWELESVLADIAAQQPELQSRSPTRRRSGGA
jgi:hypothetical protein